MPRVMITCPNTGQPIPTQLSMDAVTFSVVSMDGFVVTCRLCGEDHRWSSEEAWVIGGLVPREPRQAARETP